MLTCRQLLCKIYEDENVEMILDSLGCHSIHSEQSGDLIVCARPDGDNKRSVQVKNTESLRVVVRTTGLDGDLLDLIKEIMGFKYISQAQAYAMNICRYDENTTYIEPPLAWLNRIKRQRKYYDVDYEMPILEDLVLNQFIYGKIAQFMKDNVSLKTLIDYNIGYDVMTKRITIPIYDIYGNLVGIKGRATEDSEYKFYFLYPCDQSKTMFNHHRAKAYCKTQNEVLVFEAEKSCMQMKDMGVMNTMAIGSNNLTFSQFNILANLQCDIVLCYDNNLQDLEDRLKAVKNFFEGKRNVYVIIDKQGLLGYKDSPSDRGIEVWNKLYSNKIKIC